MGGNNETGYLAGTNHRVSVCMFESNYDIAQQGDAGGSGGRREQGGPVPLWTDPVYHSSLLL